MDEAQTWEAASPQRTWFDPFFLPLIAVALESLGEDVAGGRLLHLGCGFGSKSETFRRLGYRVTALDIDARRLTRARQDFPVIEFVEGDAHQLPFERAAFDVVFSFSTLQMMRDRRRVIAECARVLRPGGRAVFIENLQQNPLARVHRSLRERTGYGKSYDTHEYLSFDELLEFQPWFHDRRLSAFHLTTPLLLVMPALRHAFAHSPMRVQSPWLYAPLARFDAVLLRRVPFARRFGWLGVATMQRSIE